MIAKINVARGTCLIQKLGAFYADEVGSALVGNGLGQKGFPTAGWTPQQNTTSGIYAD